MSFDSIAKVTITRPKGKSKGGKEARKNAVKVEGPDRRIEKKLARAEFTTG